MRPRRELPIVPLILAAIGAVAVGVASEQAWLALVVFGLWACTFWLVPVQAVETQSKRSDLSLTQDNVRRLLDNMATPLLLVDERRIVIANAAAREILGQHVVGQDPRIGLRHPAAVALLDSNEGGTDMITGLTGRKSVWQMTRQSVDGRFWLIELLNRTIEADVSRAHTDFVANASHELRTPLANIIGYVETLLDTDGEIDRTMQDKFLGTTLREARRLQALVSDLMSLSRVEAEKHELPEQSIDLVETVRKAASESGKIEQRHRVEVSLPEAPMTIRGDRQQLEQLVRNLVDNALKYGGEDQPVSVVLTGDGSRASLRVVDRGEGIASDHLPHLTRRFYRTDPGRSRAAGGTGLGLAIVKHIVERHRGRLDIDSKQGEGTTVSVRLPLL